MIDVLASVTTVYLASICLTVGATLLAWRTGAGATSRWFVLAGVTVTLWTLGGLAQLFVRGPVQIRTFQATWILRWVAVVAWLVFVMEYTGREWRRPAVVGPVAGLFVVAASSIATSHLHDLVFSGFAVASDPTPHVTFTREIGFALLAGPAFLIIGYVFVALGRVAVATRRESRTQALALAGGVVLPAVIAIAQTTGALPFPWVRWAAVGSCTQMVGVAYGVFGGGLFRFTPIARGEVIEAIDDPIVVTDADRVVVDYNPAAADAFPGLVAGEPLARVAPQLLADTATTDGPHSTDGGDATDSAAIGLVDSEATDVTDSTAIGATESTAIGVTESTATGVVDSTAIGAADTVSVGGTELVPTVEVTVDGRRRTLVVSADPADGGAVIVCRDVTEVEAYAAELERQTEQLDRFASVVSHDLRNPLTVADGYVDMAATATDDERVSDHLDRVASAHDRMGRLIDDTLTLARQGSVVDETERVDVGEAARDAWVYVECEGRLDATRAVGHVVDADPDRLQSAFENLFRNAADHAGSDVTVTVRPTADGFVVADDGPGIPAEDRETVFDEGFTTNDDGTGFGLAIVRSIATAHGAEVSVTESEPGGAAFVFSGFDVETDANREEDATDDGDWATDERRAGATDGGSVIDGGVPTADDES